MSSATAFEEFGVMPEIVKSVEEMGWELPRDIQAECIPLILGGGDVMAAAETGSGKTGAFALPLVQIVYETLKESVSIGQGQTKSGGGAEAVAVSSVMLNVDDRDPSLALTPDGLTAQSRLGERWCGARANVGAMQGKYYYEAEVRDEGLSRVGWATRAAKLELGMDPNGFGFGGTGKKSNKKDFSEYGKPFGRGDIVGCFIDCDAGTISFSVNGEIFDVAFQIPPFLKKSAFYPTICLKNAEIGLNFGSKPFKFNPGNQFKGIQQADPSHLAQSVAPAPSSNKKAKTQRLPLALLLEPTKDLALQTHEEIAKFKKYLPAPRVDQVCLIGGQPAGQQAKALEAGAEIVTGTTGRVIEFVNNGNLDLSKIRFFVLDEADQLITQNESEVMQIWNAIPKSSNLQVLMFSATLHSPEVKRLGENICEFPTWVDLKGKDSTPETVDFAYVWADPEKNKDWIDSKPIRVHTDGVHQHDKTRPGSNTPEMYSEAIKLLKPLLLLKIINAYNMDQALIFCRTKVDCDNLEVFLNSLSGKKGPMIDTEYSCTVLHSDRSMSERLNNLKKFKEAQVRFLLCTDVAARGIDISGLPFMINYTLPDTAETFIHRCGRVGRADKLGLAVSIVGSQPEKVWFHKCSSKGKSCNNSKLLEQGGCTIWYNEKDLWGEVERRLGVTVPHLDQKFQLPQAEGVYGQKKTGGETELFLGHAQQLRPIVAELALLEDQAQKRFWELKNHKWKR